MTPDYKKLVPKDPQFKCACGDRVFSADQLVYYADPAGAEGGEGFYCVPCVTDIEEIRFMDTVELEREEIAADLMEHDLSEEAAEEVAAEMFPFEHAPMQPVLA